MNVIVILIDSANRHYLSPYGCKTVQTPSIQALADRGVTFTHHCIGSAPCMPARRELMTGRMEFLWRGWGPIEPFDRPIAQVAQQARAVTQMITDHYHYWEQGAHGYLEYFNGLEMIRGHELDYWKTELQPNEPDWAKAINKWRPGWGSRYYRNVAHFRDEDDFFAPTVYRKAAEWLDTNHNHDKFFLWIESFDSHEPFHVPEPYRSMYTDDHNPDYTCWPPYQNEAQRLAFLRGTSMAELDYIRAQYKGKLSMVDNSIGQVWAMMDKHKLWDDTMVILTSDHGHELAEAIRDLSEVTDDARDATGRNPFGKQFPHYLSHANIPLIVWHPHLMNGGKRVGGFTNAVDIYPTILEALGAEDPSAPNGRSILPMLAGEGSGRDFTYWGDYGSGICCSDGEHVLIQGCNSETPMYMYEAGMRWQSPAEAGKFIPGVDSPVWRLPAGTSEAFPSMLYRYDDPLFAERDVLSNQPETATKLRKRLREAISADGCPPEQFDRLEL